LSLFRSSSRAPWAVLWATLGCLAGCTDPEAQLPPSEDHTISLTGYIFTAVEVPDLRIGAFELSQVAPATPDDEGVFTLVGLPAGEAFVLETTGQGLVPTLQQVPSSTEDIFGYRASAPRVGGSTYPDGLAADRADVLALVQRDGYRKNGLALAQASISPAPDDGPDYLNEAAATDLSGRVLFRAVTPPEAQLVIATDRPCAAPTGWEGDTDERTRVPLAPGHLTLIETVCPDLEGARLVQGAATDATTGQPIAEAEFCTDDETCATANEAGVYELHIADAEDRVLSLTAAGYVPMQRALRNEWEASGVVTIDALATAARDDLTAAAGITQGGELGFVWIRANGSGWKASFSPPPPDDVFYLDVAGTPDPALSVATITGQAFVANVEPGAIELSLSHPGLDCRAATAWEWSADPIALPTAAGAITDVRVVCFPAATE